VHEITSGKSYKRRKKRTKPWSVVRNYMLFAESVYTMVIKHHMRKCKRYIRETTAIAVLSLLVTGNVAWYRYTQKRIHRLCFSLYPRCSSAQLHALVILQYRLSMYDCTLSCRGILSEIFRLRVFLATFLQ